MLTEHEQVILSKWRTVRATAAQSHAELDAHPLKPEHNMPAFIEQCDKAIAALEAKEAAP